MYQKEDLEKRRDELKRELEELTKNAQAQIDRLVGAIAILFQSTLPVGGATLYTR